MAIDTPVAGFGTAATLRRVFERRLRVSPSLYKASFGTGNGEAGDGIATDDAMCMDLENVVNGKSVW